MAFFQKAERKQARLRLGLCGPAGSGKTLSALLIAKGIGGKWGVVDTENKSASLYADQPMLDGWEFATLPIEAPYEIEKVMKALEIAEKEGLDGVILDSISHYWSGEGGLLERTDKFAESSKGNKYVAWRKTTPLHNKFIERMLGCKMHLIATMRSKTEYALVEENGKSIPKKIGMAPVQREGMDYEFTTVLELDLNHNAQTSKDRTSLFDGRIFTPSAKTGEALVTWLGTGSAAAEAPAPAIHMEKAAEKAEEKPKGKAKAAPKKADPAPAQQGEDAKKFDGERTKEDAQPAGFEPMTDEQRVAIRDLMLKKNIKGDKQLEFFQFVLGIDGVKSKQFGDMFIKMFDAFFSSWYRPGDEKGAPQG